MTLKQLVKTINDIAAKQPNVNTILKSGDIYTLNEDGKVDYSVFALVQGQHTETTEFRNYNLTFYFVDRLEETEYNRIEIQSHGIEVLSNIINTLRNNQDLYIDETITYQVFTESFSDVCAGVYANVIISVPISDCFEDF